MLPAERAPDFALYENIFPVVSPMHILLLTFTHSALVGSGVSGTSRSPFACWDAQYAAAVNPRFVCVLLSLRCTGIVIGTKRHKKQMACMFLLIDR